MTDKPQQNLKSVVKKAYESGKTADQIFNQLKVKHPNQDKLFETICNYPEIELRRRYAWAQYALIGLLLAFILYGIALQGVSSVLIFGFITYKLSQWNLKSYLYLYVLNGFALIAFLFLFFYQGGSSNTEGILMLAYLLSSTALSIYLDVQLSPKHEKKKLKEQDQNGKIRFRNHYSFTSPSV
jgi:hypothetical protein